MSTPASTDIDFSINGVRLPIDSISIPDESAVSLPINSISTPNESAEWNAMPSNRSNRLEFTLPYQDRRWFDGVHGVINKKAILRFEYQGGAIIHEGFFISVRLEPSETRIGFCVTYAPMRVRSSWFPERGLDIESRYSMTYLGMAADWHGERGQLETEKKIRAEIARIEEILSFKPPTLEPAKA